MKMLRERARLSQEKAAAAIGKHRTSIAKLERGEGNLNVDLMHKLAGIYACEPWELMDEAPLFSQEQRAVIATLLHVDPTKYQLIEQLALALRADESAP